jgi:hypothetical protein
MLAAAAPSRRLHIYYIDYSNIIKEFVRPKMSLNREFIIWKEGGRGGGEREGKAGEQVSRQAYLRFS